MYVGNYPGSPNGYDPNLPTGFNKWDAMEAMGEEYEPPYTPEEETESPEPSSILSESITVVNDGSISCQNSLEGHTDTIIENEGEAKG